MRLWQQSMIALARNGRLKAFMQRNATASQLAEKFVGGVDVQRALATARGLAEQGIGASLFYLGEYVHEPAAVRESVAQTLGAAEALAGAGLDVHVSIDPTQIGYSIDPARFKENALAIGRTVGALTAGRRGQRHDCLMLDMEDSELVEPTLATGRTLADQGIPVGHTLQAHLHRTAGDLAKLVTRPVSVRLVKGAFVEGSNLALQSREEIDRNFVRLAGEMLTEGARAAGFRPVFGTHDDRMMRVVADIAQSRGWTKGQYEFELLHGVRTPLLHELRDQGHAVRVYLPFGHDWWPYAARRVGEAPRNALFMARALWSALVNRA